MTRGIRRIHISVAMLLAIICFFIFPFAIWAREYTHTVKQGDTLWDICEEYYGEPDLWPKLWQMNPFITNPHLLKPGDVIVLFKAPTKVVKAPEVVQVKAAVQEAEPEPESLGISMDGLTDLESIGFLSHRKIHPWGTILASDDQKLIIAKDDTAYVLFDKDRQILAGDEFSIGTSSPLLKHPVTGKDLGYVFSIKGKLVVEKRFGLAFKNNEFYEKDNVYRVKITESEGAIYADDIVMPIQPVSPCVVPIHYQKDLLANIVAVKDQQVLIQPNSIVYIDLGFNQGIRRGNIFQVVKGQVIKDPKPEEDAHWYYESKIILPDLPVGRVMVLESRPDSSTAIVLSATEPFSKGVYIKNLPWHDISDYVETRADCPLK